MKTALFSLAFLLIIHTVLSQTIPVDSLYLGQSPPGDSSIVFAPGFISLPNRREAKIVFSPDNMECLIGIGQNNMFQILYTDFYNGYWKVPVPAYFIQNNYPIEPFFAPDSLHVFFTSYADIYRSTRENQTWSAPLKLGSPISTGYEEYHPTTALNRTLYFCSMRENSAFAVYSSVYENGTYSAIEKLPDVINRHNSEQDGAYDPFIAPDESFIIFSSIRSGGYGQADQYISYNRNGIWTNPKNLGPSINTNAIEYGSYISPDNKYYFFSRPVGWGPNAAADIYWIKIDELIDSLRYTNFVPYVKYLIPDQNALTGQLFNFTIPDSTFVDDDGNNTLTYSASLINGDPLPGWLGFDSITATFSGTPVITETLNIRITATDTAGATVSTNVKIIVKDPVSIDPADEQGEGVRIFPNPAKSLINISLDPSSVGLAKLEINNLEGKTILTNTFKNDIVINLAGRPKGMYFVRLTIDDRIITRKICVE